MAARLPDDIRLSRLRENVRNASARRRAKLAMAGNASLTVWIPDTTRAALATAAAESGLTISDMAAQWLATAAALNTTTNPTGSMTRNASNDASVALNTTTTGNRTARDLDLVADTDTTTMAICTVSNDLFSTGESTPVINTIASHNDRDTRILELHRRGLNNHEVGRQLGCSEATVRRTLKRVQRAEAV